jgi:hypothetical protein
MTDNTNESPSEERIERDLEAVTADEAHLVRDVERLEHDLDDEHRGVEVTVNKRPVRLTHRRATGLQIKEAAIAQGVNIKVDFQLAEEMGEHDEREIKDDEEVTPHDGDRFIANGPDDNSWSRPK